MDTIPGSCLQFDGTILLKEPGEDVLIVADYDDGLDNQCPRTGNGSHTSPVVPVLPSHTGVLLVEADHIGCLDGLTLAVVEPAVEVFMTPRQSYMTLGQKDLKHHEIAER